MTFREMNLRVFRGEPLPHVFFQPRIEPWYAWHKQFGKLPARYREMSLLELFDDLKVFMRYVHYYTGMPDPVVRQFSPEVKVRHHWGKQEGYVAYETPLLPRSVLGESVGAAAQGRHLYARAYRRLLPLVAAVSEGPAFRRSKGVNTPAAGRCDAGGNQRAYRR